MLNALQGVRLYAHCYTRSEVICSLLYIEGSIMLTSIHEVTLYAHCYARSEAKCSLLYMV